MKTPVYLEPMYVCGNLHRFVYQPWERDGNGKWQPYGEFCWFDSMAESVVWAISRGLQIGNWAECKVVLECEADFAAAAMMGL